MTDDTTNRHLKNWATTPKVVKAGLRAWSEHLARKRAAQAEADTAEAEPVEASEPELEPEAFLTSRDGLPGFQSAWWGSGRLVVRRAARRAWSARMRPCCRAWRMESPLCWCSSAGVT